MNKKHWNTVVLDGVIPEREIKEMIDHSYELVVQSLPKSKRELQRRLFQFSLSANSASSNQPGASPQELIG